MNQDFIPLFPVSGFFGFKLCDAIRKSCLLVDGINNLNVRVLFNKNHNP